MIFYLFLLQAFAVGFNASSEGASIQGQNLITNDGELVIPISHIGKIHHESPTIELTDIDKQNKDLERMVKLHNADARWNHGKRYIIHEYKIPGSDTKFVRQIPISFTDEVNILRIQSGFEPLTDSQKADLKRTVDKLKKDINSKIDREVLAKDLEKGNLKQETKKSSYHTEQASSVQSTDSVDPFLLTIDGFPYLIDSSGDRTILYTLGDNREIKVPLQSETKCPLLSTSKPNNGTVVDIKLEQAASSNRSSYYIDPISISYSIAARTILTESVDNHSEPPCEMIIFKDSFEGSSSGTQSSGSM